LVAPQWMCLCMILVVIVTAAPGESVHRIRAGPMRN